MPDVACPTRTLGLANERDRPPALTPEGGRIDIGAAPVDGSVEVSVSDTGVGIAPEDQEAVSTTKQEGTGLGLALARKFVELHGGQIWLKSEVGVGSKFTFTIPMRADG